MRGIRDVTFRQHPCYHRTPCTISVNHINLKKFTPNQMNNIRKPKRLKRQQVCSLRLAYSQKKWPGSRKGRVVVDIRGLNKITESDSYPLPLQTDFCRSRLSVYFHGGWKWLLPPIPSAVQGYPLPGYKKGLPKAYTYLLASLCPISETSVSDPSIKIEYVRSRRNKRKRSN